MEKTDRTVSYRNSRLLARSADRGLVKNMTAAHFVVISVSAYLPFGHVNFIASQNISVSLELSSFRIRFDFLIVSCSDDLLVSSLLFKERCPFQTHFRLGIGCLDTI
jgi:hypothetical protein